MISRTRVKRWTPPFRDALVLAWRPALAYLLFTVLGSIALLITEAVYSHGEKQVVLMGLGLGAGLAGVVLGQLISIFRVKALPVFVVGGVCIVVAIWFISMSHAPGGEYVAVPLVFFLFAFPCGLLSLMHRWELFASFWPAIGWIGGVFVILNSEDRVSVWHKNKASAWLPVPLFFLACFLLLWLVYLASKQAARVQMWQALSGAAARRISRRKDRVGPKPVGILRRNLVAILVGWLVLFVLGAFLAPYLWRTGRGDHSGGKEHEPRTEDPLPKVDGDQIVEMLKQLANAAVNTLPKLWPLLLLVVLYRPVKRALLLTHLQAPIVPTPPSERIDNLWEYVRIAAEDAGVVPTAADSVEQLLARIEKAGLASPALAEASEIYLRTRYGFTVQRGDAQAMRGHAAAAAAVFRKDLGTWKRFTNLWRPLS